MFHPFENRYNKPTWRPQQFGYQLFGTEVNFRFPIVKLLDLKQQWSELEASQNHGCYCGDGTS